MDVIVKYIPNFKNFENRQNACEELLTKFMQNYDLIIEESDSLFICKYFMSAILGLCADMDYENHRLLGQFFRFFIGKQSGIWDIWSIYEFCEKRWISMETCLGIKFERLRREPGLGLKYIIETAHKLDIEFTDPIEVRATIRFIDYPRFDASQSQSDLWRNLHRPVIDCTLLPERPDILRLLLQFGAEIPIADYHIQHILHRIKHFERVSTEEAKKKLLWIKLTISNISHTTLLCKELRIFGNQLITTFANEDQGSQRDHGVCKRFEDVPSLKHLTRHQIRSCLRCNKRLPDGIHDLEIDRISAEFVNLERIE